MKMENFSPFPNLRFYNTDNRGAEFGVLLIKGTYNIGADDRLAIADVQEPLALADGHYGAVNVSSLRMPSDLVPKKPRSDVIVNAVARAPGGRALPSWICGVRVEGRHRMEKRLRVTGSRRWEPRWSVSERVLSSLGKDERRHVFQGWALSEPEPTTEVPIRYELAFGGLQDRAQEAEGEPFFVADERNPIGRGWIDRELTSIDQPAPAPQIEDEAAPLVDPYERPAPAGLGAIPPAWLPRRPLGGTYDDHWKEHVWPDWPGDYSYAYHNSAHPDLIYPDLLVGDETVTLFGLDADAPERTLRLPGHMVMVEAERADGARPTAAMELDTLLLDLVDENPARHRAFLTWRTTFDHAAVRGVAFALVTPEDLASTEAAA